MKPTVTCGYKDKYSECSQRIYWFRKVTRVVGYSLCTMACPAVGIGQFYIIDYEFLSSE